MSKSNVKSTTDLQKVLKEKMSGVGISVHALEKKAGLKRSAVQNILQGRSKNPSAQILHAVSKILGCNINELLNDSEAALRISDKTSHQEVSTEHAFNIKLYAEAANTASDVFTKLSADLNATLSLRYIKEIYQYTVDSQLSHIDKNFATWLAGKYVLM